MKVKALLFAMFLLAGTVNAFAGTNDRGLVKPEIVNIFLSKKVNKPITETSCTVSVKSGTYKVEITWTCDCTRRDACDKAYKLAGAML